MSLSGHLALLFARLLIGAMVASVLGLILTGDVGYILILSFGIPLGILAIAWVGRALTKARRAAGGPKARVGVIGTVGQGARSLVSPTAMPTLSRILNRIVAFLPILLAFVLTLLPSAEMIGWAFTDVAAGRPFDGRDMRVGLHQQEAMDDLFKVIGGTEIYEVYFYDSYVIADAPTSPGADTSDEYEWQGGHAVRNGPELIQPDSSDRLFDVGRVDFSMLADLVRKTEADTGWTGFTEYYPAIYSFAGGDPEISIHVATDYYDATYTYDLNGELLDRSGSGFDD